MPEREISNNYRDPVDLIWLRTAEELGLKITRSSETFVAYDGKGTLTICEKADFDEDDCLAQMIFHEVCHWLVAGRHGNRLEDWGLTNVDDSDLVYEYAAIRLQASLSDPHGLRDFMAVTTDWRPYWDSLPINPLLPGDDPAIPLAQEGAHLARLEPFKSVLNRSLTATAAIADIVRGATQPSSLWSLTRGKHRLGSLLSRDENLRCGDCAWAVWKGEGEGGCRQHKQEDDSLPIIDAQERACGKWEPVFSIDDCGECGACCRQGFDSVTVADDDRFKRLHPELVQLRDDGESCVPRPEGFCVALKGNGEVATPYRCGHYESRPENCELFEVAGDACLQARRRVGLTH